MNLFVRAWRGEASLAAAFWLVYFLFGIVVLIIVSIILALVVPNFNYTIHHNMITAIEFPYTLFSAICVWRCARNSTAIWRILARIVVVLGVISGIFNIIGLFYKPAVLTPVPGTSVDTTAPATTTTQP